MVTFRVSWQVIIFLGVLIPEGDQDFCHIHCNVDPKEPIPEGAVGGYIAEGEMLQVFKEVLENLRDINLHQRGPHFIALISEYGNRLQEIALRKVGLQVRRVEEAKTKEPSEKYLMLCNNEFFQHISQHFDDDFAQINAFRNRNAHPCEPLDEAETMAIELKQICFKWEAAHPVIDTITPRDPLWRDLKLVKGVKLSIEKLEKLKADPVARRMIEKNFYRSIWETNKK